MIPLLLVFLGSAALDLAAVKWTQSVANNKAIPAMLWSGAISGVGFACVLLCIENLWLVPACIAGHMVGTLVGMISCRLDRMQWF
jgi:hypothetical protein